MHRTWQAGTGRATRRVAPTMVAHTHGEPMTHPAKLAGQWRYAVLVGGHKLLYILDCLKGDCIFCTNTPENLFHRLI